MNSTREADSKSKVAGTGTGSASAATVPPSPSLIPPAVIARAKRGHQPSIATILSTLHPELLDLIQQARIPPHDRDDAAQDAILTVMRCLATFDPSHGATFEAYVGVTIRFMLLKFRGDPRLTFLDAPLERPYDQSVAHIEAGDVLETVTKRHAAIVREYYGIGRQELSVNQIAARRGMAPRRVQAAITEALQAMREAS